MNPTHVESRGLRPERVLQERADPLEVAKYYLEISLFKLFGDDLQPAIQRRVADMDDESVWRMVEAFSVTRGLNDVFWFLTNESYVWSQEVWSMEGLRLTGINPEIDKVIKAVDRQPLKLRDYLTDYFAKYPMSDPEHLNELRPRQQPVVYPIILLREHEDQPAILDGSHRLIELLQQDATSVTAYVGRGDNRARHRLGPSIFRTLRIAYDRSRDETVIATVRRLIDQSVDGRWWVQVYWIDHSNDEAIRQKGRELLN